MGLRGQEMGRGKSWRLFLQQEDPLRVPPDASPTGRLGRVLVADGEPSVRKLMILSLEKAGYGVVEAENGQQAIESLNAGHTPFMVETMLCDIRMPKIDGIDTIASCRSPYPSVSVVLTGYPDVELAVSLMKLEVRDYLDKPAAKDDLLRAIRSAVEHHELFENQFIA